MKMYLMRYTKNYITDMNVHFLGPSRLYENVPISKLEAQNFSMTMYIEKFGLEILWSNIMHY